jgi:heme o synthase
MRFPGNTSYPGHVFRRVWGRMAMLARLVRAGLSLAIAFSALAGYVLFSHTLDWKSFFTFTGVFLLSCAASVLNQYQERNADALMKRTRDRPLPAGLIRPFAALVISVFLALAGLVLLYVAASPLTAGLGLFNLLWYNAVYTQLKKKTRYAVLIGALCGSVPPVMGWCAAGGFPLSPVILFFAFFMFLWQIPHFMLLLLKHGRDYAGAGFRSLLKRQDLSGARTTVFIWILAASLSTLLFPVLHIMHNPVLITGLVMLNAAAVLFFYRALFTPRRIFGFNSAFRCIYLYQACVILLLVL